MDTHTHTQVSLVPSLHSQLFFACGKSRFFYNMRKKAGSGDWERGYTQVKREIEVMIFHTFKTACSTDILTGRRVTPSLLATAWYTTHMVIGIPLFSCRTCQVCVGVWEGDGNTDDAG